jgi:hypothetical protein
MAINFIVNEQATFWLTVSFFDKNSSAAAPSGISWTIYDGIDGTLLTTGATFPATSIEVTIDSTYNAIRHGKQFEERRFNVRALFSTGQQTAEYLWQVKNLGFSI